VLNPPQDAENEIMYLFPLLTTLNLTNAKIQKSVYGNNKPVGVLT